MCCAVLCCCSARMNFLGLFTFTAPYLPWVLLAFSFVLGNNGVVDVVGIGVGHLYYFLEDVYPLMLPSRKRVLATPRLIQLLFHNPNDEQHVADQLPHIIHEEHIQQHMQQHDTEQQRPHEQQQRQQREEGQQEEEEAAELQAGANASLPQDAERQADAELERKAQNDDEVANTEISGMHRRSLGAAPNEVAAPL